LQSDQQVTNSTSSALPFCLPESREKDADLARIVEAWPMLPDAMKAGIVAMVEASRS
jgi:hypothetical protein